MEAEQTVEVSEDLAAHIQSRIETMRPKLLDLTRRNPLISTRLTPKSTSIVRFVDELPDVLAFHLLNGTRLRLVPLPALEDAPLEESTEEFQEALSTLRLTDSDYLEALSKIDPNSEAGLDRLQAAESALGDRVREALSIPIRQHRTKPSIAEHARAHGIAPSYDLPEPIDEHADGRHRDTDIQTLFLPKELERRLNQLTAKCRTWTEETGLNVLSAAFGFLEWKEPSSTESQFSPLILLPIEIDKEKTPSGTEFWISALGEPAETNVVLTEKLRLEFGIELPQFDGNSMEDYWARLQSSSPASLPWKIRRQAACGIFPSARIAMYHDLDTTKRNFEQCAAVAALLGSTAAGELSPFASEYDVDAKENQIPTTSTVLDADSSQFSVLIDLARGKSLAVEGPPGSGKSQTIVNAIAGALSSGKSVLFVAEKNAALEVVRSRLESLNLGDFILPLQADRSTRGQVIQSVRQRLTLSPPKAPQALDIKIAQFEAAREELADYIGISTSDFQRSGLTVHQIIARALSTAYLLDGLPDAIRTTEIPNIGESSASKRVEIQNGARRLEGAWEAAMSAGTSWADIRAVGLHSFDANQAVRDMEVAAEAASVAAKEAESLGRMNVHFLPHETDILDQLIRKILESAASTDLGLVGRLAMSEAGSVVEAFLAQAKKVGEYEIAVARTIAQPLDPSVPQRLREIASICEQANVPKPNLLELDRDIADLSAALQKSELDAGRLSQLLTRVPNASQLPVSAIRLASSIARTANKDAAALRATVPWDHPLLAMAARLIAEMRTILERRTELEKTIATTGSETAEVVRGHIATLRSATLLSRFGRTYKAARQYYLSITRRETFALNDAVADLSQLADWLSAMQSAMEAEKATPFFGPYVRTLDQSLDDFSRLVEFYAAIESQLAGDDNKPLREYLRTASFEELLALPEFSGLEFEGPIQDIAGYWAKQRADYDQKQRAAKRLQSYQSIFVGNVPATSSLVDVSKNLERLQAVKRTLDGDERAKEILQSRFVGVKTTRESVEPELGIASALRAGPWREAVGSILASGRFDDLKTVWEGFRHANDTLRRNLSDVDDRCGTSFYSSITSVPLTDLTEKLRRAAADREGLLLFAAFASEKATFASFGLNWVVDALAATPEGLKDLPGKIDATVMYGLARAVYREYGPRLSKHSGLTLDAARYRLADADREVMKLSREMVRRNTCLAAKPPAGVNTGKKSEWTEMALLNNECAKKQRFISARDLTRRAGRALKALKPCWMMSPLAAAQYLPAGGHMVFDLCIIDEASQMPPEDAIGAIARCKQVLVVGDTNQLPPTSFFRKVLEDEGADDDELVLEESILEIANAVFRPARRLRWHYRSQHSSLIQFSNHYIYNNDLVVFPSPTDRREGMGVSLHPVKGLCRSGVNTEEAVAMVREACAFMRKWPGRSLGLVTMNQKQRDLLQEEMERAVARDKRAADYIERWQEERDGLEPFFIKNLENVQGDERDAIFIGTVYGPEAIGGGVRQNFGPINGVAGRRRLNVLFTRAKQVVITFSSMTASDIKADDFGNPGALLLRRWLEYSASGVTSALVASVRDPDSAFETFVADQVRAIGCEPVPQVGVAGYFIDIGVRHPKWPYGYILGVECDGATYHSSKSARDRDRLREEVLNRLGWTLHRIWSTDWFSDPGRQANRLRAVIEQRVADLLQTLSEAERFPAAGERDLPDAQDGDSDQAAHDSWAEAPESTEDDEVPPPNEGGAASAAVNEYADVGDAVTISFDDDSLPPRTLVISDIQGQPGDTVISPNSSLGSALLGTEEGDRVKVLEDNVVLNARVTRMVKGRAMAMNAGSALSASNVGEGHSTESISTGSSGLVLPSLDPGAFYDRRYLPVLRQHAIHAVDTLGPISFPHLGSLVAKYHGFPKAIPAIKKQVWKAVGGRRRATRAPDGVNVFWPEGMTPNVTVRFRGLEVGGQARTWSDVPYPEKLGLALEVVSQRSSGDLAGEMARLIGFQRLRATTRDELNALLAAAKKLKPPSAAASPGRRPSAGDSAVH